TAEKGVQVRLRNLGYDPAPLPAEGSGEAHEDDHGEDSGEHGGESTEAHGEDAHADDAHGEGHAGDSHGGGHGAGSHGVAMRAPETRQALIEFQLDHDLPATGLLDDDTKHALEEAYGA